MTQTRTPIRAIRHFCVHHCCCGQPKEVRLCLCTTCELYPYRMGHRPKSNENSEISKDLEDKELEG